MRAIGASAFGQKRSFMRGRFASRLAVRNSDVNNSDIFRVFVAHAENQPRMLVHSKENGTGGYSQGIIRQLHAGASMTRFAL